MAFRAVTQKPLAYFKNLDKEGAFDEHNIQNGVTKVGEKDGSEPNGYQNLYNLVTHTEMREMVDVTTKYIFAVVLTKALKAVGYFEDGAEDLDKEEVLIAKLIGHFIECIQFNCHMIDSVYSNRLIAPDSETRMWKDAHRFALGEFVETHSLGGGVFPTMAYVNHSCDPNFTIVNFLGNQAVAFANRTIEKGEELHDTYGAVFYYMDKGERQHYLKVIVFSGNRSIKNSNLRIYDMMLLSGFTLVYLHLQTLLG